MFWNFRSKNPSKSPEVDDKSTADESARAGDPMAPEGGSSSLWDTSEAATQAARRELTVRSLVELSDALNTNTDPFEIADVAQFNLMGQYGCSKAALWLVPADRTGAVLLRSYGIPPGLGRAIGAIWLEWLKKNEVREAMLVEELKKVGSVPGVDLAEEADIALLAPVTAHGKLIGAIALGPRVSGAPFSHRDLHALHGSLNFIGIALENASFANQMTENNRRLRIANEQLQELDALKSDFLRNLNHELRTPLTVISGYVDSLLMADSLTPEVRTDHLKALRLQTSQLEVMVMRLLDFGKLRDDALEADVRPTDLVAVLRAYCSERRPGIAADLRDLRFSHAADIPVALADRMWVLRVVEALVDNAVKFCPGGSRIHVRVEAEKNRVRVDVIDDGPGIPPDQVDHIWESFRQGDGSATRPQTGVGMGLPFARELCEKMGGSLDVTTELGEGTTFSARLRTG